MRLSAANVRALWDRPLWWATATVWAIRFQVAQIGGFQNRPICVWSGVRVEPVRCAERLDLVDGRGVLARW